MDEGGEVAAGSPALRIFIGGLGVAVTAADLEDRFSSLGKVRGTELVRSGGRSFAYIDFEPNSDKALAKLFAVYNGCTWKGGKLKLEKAKEHYMARLKREWSEDARVNTSDDTGNKGSEDHLNNSEHSDKENKHIHIFFPKLGKVKALPMKGTGKHKYSFQRIEVPALPIHFCDCEEHCDTSETINEKYTLALNSAAYEKERSIINNVMERLLGKEHDEIPESETRIPPPSAKDMDDIDNMTRGTQSEDEDDDMNNLVTNIGVGQGDDILMQLIGANKHLVDQVQEPRISMSEPHKSKLSQKKTQPVKSQKTEGSSITKVNLNQVTSPTRDKNSGEDAFITASTKNQISKGMENREVVAEVPPGKNPAGDIIDSIKSATSNPWMQKSSWKKLVGESSNRSFSLSNVFSVTDPMVSEPLNAKDYSSVSSLTRKKRKSKSDGDASIPLEAEQKKIKTQRVVEMSITPEITSNQACSQLPDDKIIEIESGVKQDSNDVVDEGENFTEASNVTNTVKSPITSSWVQKSSWKELVGESGNSSFSLSQVFSGMNVVAQKPSIAKDSVSPASRSNGEGLIPTTEQVSGPERTVEPVIVDVVKTSVEHNNNQDMKTSHQEQRRTIPKINIGEVCTFMRTAESEKQWSKAKTALSGYLKKKSRDSTSSKEPNGGLRGRRQ